MFKSKQRPVVIPQSEHLRLSGAIAFLWGNDQFDQAPIPLLSFVAGVGLHDQAYGYLDNLPIGEIGEERWLELAKKGFQMSISDPIGDVVARMHIKRLVNFQDTPARRLLSQEMQQEIQKQVTDLGISMEVFQRIDRITNFCDKVSFDVCFEAPSQGEVRVYPRNGSDQEVGLTYRFDGKQVVIEPWPLRVDSYSGYLVGYQLEGYPDRLDPVIVPFNLHKS